VMDNLHRELRRVFLPDDRRIPGKKLPTRMCPDVS